MAKLRIAFSGIGAVGGYYGGMVAARYQGTIKADIFFIARGENLKAIREKGSLPALSRRDYRWLVPEPYGLSGCLVAFVNLFHG